MRTMIKELPKSWAWYKNITTFSNMVSGGVAVTSGVVK